jgi:hypothetical protein
VTGGGDERLVAAAELDDPALVETADVDPAGVEELAFVVVDLDGAEDEADGDAELDCVIEVAPEDALETIDEVCEVDLLEDGAAEEGGLLDEGAADDDGGLLELALPFGTGATTPPCTVPLTDVEEPAALDL